MGGYAGQDTFVCTTCGCVVATEYGTRHIAWENTTKGAAVVTADAAASSTRYFPLGT
jgi:transcription initiation factor TFIIIB Brf1 subunit/transcription initiation factor TFIIB